MKAKESAEATTFFITPAQLCIGLHVHLDLSWSEHPFTFSNFKIKSEEQIATLRSLGLSRLRYSPSKSDRQPLPVAAMDTSTESASEPGLAAPVPVPRTPIAQPIMDLKQGRQGQIAAYRERLAHCERELAAHARLVESLERKLHTQPAEVRESTESLVNAMTASMLLEAEVSIHLMADKVGGERVYLHNLNVTVMSLMLARELKLSAQELNHLGMGAMFHDVGLAAVPAHVPKGDQTARTPAERDAYAQHGQHGVKDGMRLGLSAEALQIIAQHHEYADGSGYPKRLKGSQISRLAQIVRIADEFDALCNPVGGGKPMTPHEALSHMYGQQRLRFDSTALMTFVRCVGIYPPGTVVGLSDGSLGMVLTVNSSRPLKPTVVVCDLTVPRAQATVLDLEQETQISIQRSLRPEQLPREQFDYLSPRQRTAYYFSSEAKAA